MSHLDRLLAKQIAERTPTPARPDDSDQRQGVPSTTLPTHHVAVDYGACMVAVLFEPSDIPALVAHPLFAAEADELRRAASYAEAEIESQILEARDRQIRGVG